MAARRLTLVVLTLLLGAWPFLAAAQDATPITASGAPLDLAAMALAHDDVPAGYFDDYSEWWVPAAPFSELVLGGIDLLRCGICGEENALLPFADDARSGFARGIVLGPVVDGETQPPFVSLAISTFTSPEVALAVLEAIRQAPNDRPTAVPFPRGKKTLADDPVIPEATTALAFHATLDEEDPNAPVDSAGVDFVVGNRLATVDVQGGLSAEVAMAAAIDLANQQAACLAAGAPCAAVMAPPGLQADPAG